SRSRRELTRQGVMSSSGMPCDRTWFQSKRRVNRGTLTLGSAQERARLFFVSATAGKDEPGRAPRKVRARLPTPVMLLIGVRPGSIARWRPLLLGLCAGAGFSAD